MERVVVVGASAGGIPALETICAELQPDFQAPILIVMHVPPQGNKLLEALGKCCRLPASHAIDGQYAEPGAILVAAPGSNLTIVNDHGRVRVRLTDCGDPKLMRPAINSLFLSAADSFQDRVVGMVLSGFLDDGADGLRAIKKAGGSAIVQDPVDALCPDMPLHAIHAVEVDSILHATAIGAVLSALVAAPVGRPTRLAVPAPERAPAKKSMDIEVAGAAVPASFARAKK